MRRPGSVSLTRKHQRLPSTPSTEGFGWKGSAASWRGSSELAAALLLTLRTWEPLV
ncbi:hypothetical protein E2C01_072456 [Portunus trituberculatus]|uniref:Uncharacterized protein n=1 Tax=Portunus trituberculatus TaxID=210409 RepID=A0A5B7I7S6_PORTR|nr:hypothetical protein [Portunus trituberculatus]